MVTETRGRTVKTRVHDLSEPVETDKFRLVVQRVAPLDGLSRLLQLEAWERPPLRSEWVRLTLPGVCRCTESDTSNMITIKPHHFVDIVTALGDGCCDFQPHPYGHAVHSVAKEILADRDILLCIELGARTFARPAATISTGSATTRLTLHFDHRPRRRNESNNLLIDRRLV